MGDNVKTRQGSRWSLKSTLRLSSRKGHVHLVVNNQVRRVCLPDRVTHLDTVRALFVRAFPQAVTWDNFKTPPPGSGSKGLPPSILVLNPNVNLFYPLSDLSQVRHGCVLKLSPAGATLPHSSSAHSNCVANAEPPPAPSVHHSHSDTELELRLTGMNSKSSGQPPTSQQQQQQQQQHHRHCTKAGATGSGAPASPKRLHHSQTHPGMPDPPGPPLGPQQELVCTCPPEFHQMLYEHQLLQQHQHQMAAAASSRSGQTMIPPLDAGAYPPAYSAPPVPPHPSSIDMNGAATGLPVGILPPELEASFLAEATGPKPHSRMALMEAQLAHLTAWVQTLQASGVAPCPPPGPLPPSVVGQQAFTPSNSSLDSAYSARSTTSSDASTSQSTQTPPFPRRGLPHPPVPGGMSPGLRQKMAHIQSQVGSLREEWAGLRSMQLETQATFRKEMETALQQMQYVVASIPGAREEPIRAERCRLEEAVREYKEEVARVETRLRDLEMAVEEVRGDVLTRKCRVNGQEVENLALHLSHVSQALANLKTSRLPPLCSRLKALLHAEMDTAMRDESFLKTEAASIEKTLKRCKKLIGMLFTLKKLSGVQHRDHRDNDDDLSRLSDAGADSEEDELPPLPPPPSAQDLPAPTSGRKPQANNNPVPPSGSVGLNNASTSSNSSSASSATLPCGQAAPILKTSSSSSSGATPKGVAFSKTVLVEDGSRRELNDDDDDDDNDLSAPAVPDCNDAHHGHGNSAAGLHGPSAAHAGSKRTPPPPPPRRNSRGCVTQAPPAGDQAGCAGNGAPDGCAVVGGPQACVGHGPNSTEVWQRRRDGAEATAVTATVKKFAS